MKFAICNLDMFHGAACHTFPSMHDRWASNATFMLLRNQSDWLFDIVTVTLDLNIVSSF